VDISRILVLFEEQRDRCDGEILMNVDWSDDAEHEYSFWRGRTGRQGDGEPSVAANAVKEAWKLFRTLELG
jgi:hypothetical protein